MSISEIHAGKHRQSCFTKSATVSSERDAETRAAPPLFRHSDVTAHLIIEQITVMDDPGFQNEC